MARNAPYRVAIVGGGCASIAAAFELTRPEHRGRYQVTVYQLGWRLGGKGASGRGAADRIEEHGLHLWLGYYENAFKLMRECYTELERDPARCPIATWRDAFLPASSVALADHAPPDGWESWVAHFPPEPGDPGDPVDGTNPFSVASYMARSARLVASLLQSVETARQPAQNDLDTAFGVPELIDAAERFLRYGRLATFAAVLEGASLLAALLEAIPALPNSLVLPLIDAVASGARSTLERLVERDAGLRRLWEVVDVILASLRGSIRFGLATDPRGYDAINDYEMRDWLRMNGASESSLDSAFVRGFYDLAFAFVEGDPRRPSIAAGAGMRGAVRMFFTYRGALFWKMRGGMGDIVFAPFYEVLKRRGVRFQFFHRLENVRLADPATLASGDAPHIESLEFDVQARIRGGREYQPLIDVRGLPCWPSQPDYRQLIEGSKFRREDWQFESHWDQRRVGTKTLRVRKDFDFVVLGVNVGAIPHVCRELVERDERWQAMVRHTRTVATQSMQLWLEESMQDLGWESPSVSLSAFVQPFDTWADMGHLVGQESWPEERVQGVAYFCSVLATPDGVPDRHAGFADYPAGQRERVRRNAIRFLERDLRHLWPGAVSRSGEFRWQLLASPNGLGSGRGSKRFDSQYWVANVNPTDRYVLSVPGSLRHRISPLDNSYDNLTIAGDWTDCGHNLGCVESAVMSGRLAAHALSGWPPLEHIVGYDHP